MPKWVENVPNSSPDVDVSYLNTYRFSFSRKNIIHFHNNSIIHNHNTLYTKKLHQSFQIFKFALNKNFLSANSVTCILFIFCYKARLW